MSHPVSQNPSERFSQYFHVSPALDDASRDEVYFIRHEVFARDLGFEPERADQRETDQFDRQSAHCILRTADEARSPVGCARVVLADPADPHAPLPFEIYCKDSLDRSIIDPAKLPREQIGEASRLAIMKGYRRRRGEQRADLSIAPEDTGGEPVARFPNIPLCLYFAAVALAQRNGVEYIFTLTEPRLAKHFAMIGVNIQTVGRAIDHRGLRVPSMSRISEVYPRLRALVRPLWHEVHAQINAGYMLHAAMQPSADFDEPALVSTFGEISA